MLRLNWILAGVPVGLLAGAIAWTFGGGAAANIDGLAPVSAQVAALKQPPSGRGDTPPAAFADLQASPIFALSVGPGAVKEPALRLDGVALSSRRVAALLSIDGRPSEWFALGETRGGITVQQIRAGGVVIDTVLGARNLAVGQQTGPELAEAAAPPSAASPVLPPQPPHGPDFMPPGFHSPPPPASAPK